MIIDVCDNFQIRSTDSMNWQVFQYKEVNERPGRKPNGNKVKKWVALPSYHSNPASAVEWISIQIPKSKSDKTKRDLKSFLKDYDEISKKISKAAKTIQGDK